MTNKNNNEEWKEEFNKKYLNQLIPETNEIGNYWSLKVDYYNDFLPFVIAQIQAAEKRGKREGLMIVRHILEKGGNALDLVVEISEKVDQSIAN